MRRAAYRLVSVLCLSHCWSVGNESAACCGLPVLQCRYDTASVLEEPHRIARRVRPMDRYGLTRSATC